MEVVNVILGWELLCWRELQYWPWKDSWLVVDALEVCIFTPTCRWASGPLRALASASLLRANRATAGRPCLSLLASDLFPTNGCRCITANSEFVGVHRNAEFRQALAH
ncbi:MAG: hypothetical protein COB24_10760 [Hyphomicrobiales bacterium]|nr:MAG: hypothetical protein COB24_10760 [Hyphomicrobiales bacterium]